MTSIHDRTQRPETTPHFRDHADLISDPYGGVFPDFDENVAENLAQIRADRLINREPAGEYGGVFTGLSELSFVQKTLLGMGALASAAALLNGPAIGRKIERSGRAIENMIAPIPKQPKPHVIVKHNVRVAGDTEVVMSDYKGESSK
jgi:hypothetical protein